MLLDREELARQAFNNRIHRNPDADKAATATAAFEDANAFIAAAKADRAARGEPTDDPPTPDQLAPVNAKVDALSAALEGNVAKITEHINTAQDGDANRFIELTEALKASDAQHTATADALKATVEQLVQDVAALKGAPPAAVEIPPPPPPLAVPEIAPPTPLEPAAVDTPAEAAPATNEAAPATDAAASDTPAGAA